MTRIVTSTRPKSPSPVIASVAPVATPKAKALPSTDGFTAAKTATAQYQAVYDGSSPAAGTTGENVAQPASPPLSNRPGERSRAKYDDVINQFAVGVNRRYRIRDTSGDGVADTFCNIFAWDVMSAMGVQLPHWVTGNGVPAKPFAPGAYELDANSVNRWLNDQGGQHGWKEISPEEAQRMANLGMPVVASQYVSPIGHIGVVRPGEFSSSRGPALAQAGATNINQGRAYDYFTPGKVQFFVNTSGGAPANGGAPSTPSTPSTAPSSVASQVPQSDLSRGMEGPEVETLQRALVKLGYMTNEQVATGPGIFGPRTQAAVQAFQTASGIIPAYGNYGPLTRAALSKALLAKEPKRTAPPAPLERGDVSKNVQRLKQGLNALGFMSDEAMLKPQTKFGSGTEAAVKRFQKWAGVPQTGRYDERTEKAFAKALAGVSGSASTSTSTSTTAAKLDALLANSGLRGQGANMLAFAKKYDVPVELALAMLWHEAQWSTTGRTPSWNNPGNLRFTGDLKMQPGAFDDQGFAHFPDVKTGLEAYFRLLDVGYRKFIDQKDWAGLVHKYAPAFDGNDERRYVEVLEQLMPMYRQKLK